MRRRARGWTRNEPSVGEGRGLRRDDDERVSHGRRLRQQRMARRRAQLTLIELAGLMRGRWSGALVVHAYDAGKRILIRRQGKGGRGKAKQRKVQGERIGDDAAREPPPQGSAS